MHFYGYHYLLLIWYTKIKEEDHLADEKKTYIINGEHVTLEEYRKTKYEDLRIRVPKGKKDVIKKHVESTGESLNTFVNMAIDEKILRDKQKIEMNNN